MRIAPILALLMILANSAAAQTDDRTARILEAWKAWAEENAISATSISIGAGGEILASDGHGRDPKTAYPIASLTKAITAVCLKQVAEEQGLPLSTSLGDVRSRFESVGVAIPDAIEDRSIADVMTMSAGLQPDRSQGRFDESSSYGSESNAKFSNLALAAQGLEGEKGVFFYNNGAYAVLGALLEALTGTDNVTACRDRVFPEGFGATAGLDPVWGGLGAFGGWQASTRDYTAFAMEAFDPEGDISANVARLPLYSDPEGWNYGLGVYLRVIDGHNVFWHRGALCRIDGEEQGAFFAYYGTGYVVTVTYSACGQGDIARNLDRAMFAAAQF